MLKSKEQKAVTLISLVITIIILIILSAIAINFTLGNNGIISRAKESKKMQIIADTKEKIGIEIVAIQAKAIEKNEEVEQEQIENIISKYGTLQEDNDTIILNDSNYTISLKEIYNGNINNEQNSKENKVLYQVSAALHNSGTNSDGIIMMPNTENTGRISGGKTIAGFLSDKLHLEEDNKLSLPKGKYIFESYVPSRSPIYGVGFKIIDSTGTTIADHTANATTDVLYSTEFTLEKETDISIYWYKASSAWTDLIYYRIKEV